jgi:hypothetical protein
LAAIGLNWPASGQGIFLAVESPNDSRDQEGTDATFPPFIGRYQQVYGAWDFAGVRAAGGGWLYSVGFRLDVRFGFGFVGRFTNVQINFSTTQRGPDGLSPVFAENVGSDEIMAFQRDVLTIAPVYFYMASPQPYQIRVELDEPFFYNPAKGNLFLDVRFFGGYGGPTVPHIDSWNRTGDSVSRVYAAIGETSGRVDTTGAVTEFGFSLVPKLTVSLQSSNLLFRWPRVPAEFGLQQSPVLGSGTTWQPAGGIVTTNGSNIEVTLPVDPNAPARFFRLVSLASTSGAAESQLNNGATAFQNQER